MKKNKLSFSSLTFYRPMKKISIFGRQFLRKNHKELKNKNEIFNMIDTSLGCKTPPAIEYIYVTPVKSYKIFSSDSSINPYGHALVRYTIKSQNKQYIMNIVGKGGKMVHIMDPTDYLFTNPKVKMLEGSEQGGVYNRSFSGFRIEEWDEEKIIKMHEYFLKIEKENEEQKIGYSLLFGPLISKWFPNVNEKGNCSYWTSKGMCEAGILKTPTLWPKFLFSVLYFTCGKEHYNHNIVFYKCMKEEKQLNGWLKPFFWISNELFKNLKKFANIIVDYKKEGDEMEAIIRKNENPIRLFKDKK